MSRFAHWRLTFSLLRGASARDHLRTALTVLGIALAVLAGVIGSIGPRVMSAQQRVIDGRAPVTGELRPGAPVLQVSVDTIVLKGRTWYQYTAYGATGSSPKPDGLKAWPAPGHSIISPALASALTAEGRANLGTVDPTRLSGSILAAPDEYVSYRVVDTPLSADDGPVKSTVAAFGQSGSQASSSGTLVAVEMLVLIGAPAGLMLAVVFRLAVAARARRTYALHLVGVNERALARMYANELSVAVVAGFVLALACSRLLMPVLESHHVLGLSWWPRQAALPWPVVITLGVLVVAASRLLCRRAVRAAVSEPKATRSGVPWVAPVAALVFVAGLAFLAKTVLDAARAPKGGEASQGLELITAIITLVTLAALVLLGAWGTTRAAQALFGIDRTPWFLGSRAAAHRAASTGRLAAFVAVAVMLCGLAPGFLGTLAWTSQGDLTASPIYVQLDGIPAANRPKIAGLRSNHPVVIEVLAGTGTSLRMVKVADCDALSTITSSTEDGHIQNCTGRPQVGALAAAGSTNEPVVINGLGTIAVDSTRIGGTSADMVLPPTQANLRWAERQKQGTVILTASRADGSFARALADVNSTLRPLSIDANVKNPEQYAQYLQQRTIVAAGLTVGLVLALLSFLLTSIELRWAARRSTAVLSAVGAQASVLRRATAVQFLIPLVVCGVPGWLLGTVAGLSFMALNTTTGHVFSVDTWTPSGLALAGCLVLAVGCGFLTGAGKFTPEAVADR